MLFADYCFSALQRAEIAEIRTQIRRGGPDENVSVLFNEPKLLKFAAMLALKLCHYLVSVLFNEPKLLKFIPSYSNIRRLR